MIRGKGMGAGRRWEKWRRNKDICDSVKNKVQEEGYGS